MQKKIKNGKARTRIMRLSSINLRRFATPNKATKIQRFGRVLNFKYEDIIDFEVVPNVVSSGPIRLVLSRFLSVERSTNSFGLVFDCSESCRTP